MSWAISGMGSGSIHVILRRLGRDFSILAQRRHGLSSAIQAFPRVCYASTWSETPCASSSSKGEHGRKHDGRKLHHSRPRQKNLVLPRRQEGAWRIHGCGRGAQVHRAHGVALGRRIQYADHERAGTRRMQGHSGSHMGPIWCLPPSKRQCPDKINMLRPSAILLASAKLWGRCFFTILGEYDAERSPSHLGFWVGHSCSELVTAVRMLLETRSEWRLRACRVQIDVNPRRNGQAEGSPSTCVGMCHEGQMSLHGPRRPPPGVFRITYT